ncbi:spore germination protein [Eubacterium sp. OM08-24]|jgi:stage V sporulation protein AF|uniref:spore germination protein n=1 Tax=Eubacterium sp. OM08-24 TaxID=2292352 RepID=UPI000E4384C6|nr:spore germination protein [Eubacterium sp. OM08-24]RGM17434.1 spore germination protein [Eubacterium sp. OM08-24]
MFTTDYNTNLQVLSDALRSEQSFDLVKRELVIANRRATIFFIDGLLKDDITEKILEFFYKNVKDENFKSALYFSQSAVPYVEVEVSAELKKVCTDVLSGISALIVEGFTEVILLDTRTYPQRSTSEPDNDKVLRGSRDGFVETLINNTALIRRRIRDTNLTVKAYSVGTQSHTDVAVIYMENKVDKKLLANLDKRLNAINVPSLTMNQQSLVEALYKNLWYNPFPKVKHTERPDTTASAILDGNIVILVDNAPSALLLPTSIFDVLEEADDYYFPPVTGTYLKLARYFITIITVLITPLWLLAIQNPDYCPDFFRFVLLSEPQNIPVFWQLILMEVGIDGLRLAALNTPNSLTTPLSIIGAIALSEFAVDSGWVSMEAILYMALVTVANFTQPNFELGYSLKFCRILLLVLTYIFNVWGFIIAFVINLVLLCTNRTLSNKSYLYPLIPFNGKEFFRKILRIRNPR